METINEMRERHGREIEELQKNCKHPEISDWMNYMWAPGHFLGKVKVCKICGEIVERDPSLDIIQESLLHPDITPEELAGLYEEAEKFAENK